MLLTTLSIYAQDYQRGAYDCDSDTCYLRELYLDYKAKVRSDHELGVEMANHYVNFAKEKNLASVSGRGYYMQGDAKAMVQEFAASKLLVEKAIALAKAYNDVILHADCLNLLGNSYSDLGDYDKAKEYYTICLTISEESGYKKGISNGWTNIGIAEYFQGNHALAIANFNKSIPILEEIRDSTNLNIAYDLWHRECGRVFAHRFQDTNDPFNVGDIRHLLVKIGGVTALRQPRCAGRRKSEDLMR